MMKSLRWFALVLFTLLPALASAQQQGLEIDIIGGNASALPITVVPMPYQGSATAPPTDVADVVRADLERSGAFRTLPDADRASIAELWDTRAYAEPETGVRYTSSDPLAEAGRLAVIRDRAEGGA